MPSSPSISDISSNFIPPYSRSYSPKDPALELFHHAQVRRHAPPYHLQNPFRNPHRLFHPRNSSISHTYSSKLRQQMYRSRGLLSCHNVPSHETFRNSLCSLALAVLAARKLHSCWREFGWKNGSPHLGWPKLVMQLHEDRCEESRLVEMEGRIMVTIG